MLPQKKSWASVLIVLIARAVYCHHLKLTDSQAHLTPRETNKEKTIKKSNLIKLDRGRVESNLLA